MASDDLCGPWALYRAPEAVVDVHRSYVAAGCDVISTDTWSVLADADRDGSAAGGLVHWMDIAPVGIRHAQTAASEGPGRGPTRMEELSDAHHLAVGGDNVMIAYLLEVPRAALPDR